MVTRHLAMPGLVPFQASRGSADCQRHVVDLLVADAGAQVDAHVADVALHRIGQSGAVDQRQEGADGFVAVDLHAAGRSHHQRGVVSLGNRQTVGLLVADTGRHVQAQHQPDTTEETYLRIIHGKTSRLFELATEGAAILAGREEYREPLRRFAGHFGNAFQIIDDILDYTSDADTLGKNIGDDLMEGKPTLPLISALAHSTGDDHAIIRRSIATGGIEHLDKVIEIVHNSGGLDYCQKRAKQETDAALEALKALPDNEYRQALINLTLMALHRLQ